MTTPNRPHPYRVLETEQFDAQWQRAMRLGYINPMADPAILMHIRELLAHRPYTMRRPPHDVPANRRRIQLNPRVWLWYSVIEDDRTVHMESVRIIGLD